MRRQHFCEATKLAYLPGYRRHPLCVGCCAKKLVIFRVASIKYTLLYNNFATTACLESDGDGSDWPSGLWHVFGRLERRF